MKSVTDWSKNGEERVMLHIFFEVSLESVEMDYGGSLL